MSTSNPALSSPKANKLHSGHIFNALCLGAVGMGAAYLVDRTLLSQKIYETVEAHTATPCYEDACNTVIDPIESPIYGIKTQPLIIRQEISPESYTAGSGKDLRICFHQTTKISRQSDIAKALNVGRYTENSYYSLKDPGIGYLTSDRNNYINNNGRTVYSAFISDKEICQAPANDPSAAPKP